MTTPQEFRAVRMRHRAVFAFCREVLEVLERAVIAQRSLPDLPARALDMLLIQTFKSLQSTNELCLLALTEDAATIARRLLEIAIQAIYIAQDSEQATRIERAGMYLAFLWHKWPDDLHEVIPLPERQAWERIYEQFGTHLSAKSYRWGPRFSEMFEYAEQKDTYTLDYSHLSSIAHGSPSMLVHDYAQERVFLHDDRHVPSLLVFASGYALGTLIVWNDIFHLVESDRVSALLNMHADLRSNH